MGVLTLTLYERYDPLIHHSVATHLLANAPILHHNPVLSCPMDLLGPNSLGMVLRTCRVRNNPDLALSWV